MNTEKMEKFRELGYELLDTSEKTEGGVIKRSLLLRYDGRNYIVLAQHSGQELGVMVIGTNERRLEAASRVPVSQVNRDM